jgi:hypothetical protein
MRKVDIFYGHLECIKAIWYILWVFGNSVAIKGRRNGFFECRIELYHKANVKLVISQICIVT